MNLAIARFVGEPGPPSRAELAAYVEAVGRVVADALPGYLSVLWKGSAVKPWEGPYDFLPGLSDLDVHVYRPGGQGDGWELRQRIADLGPAPGATPLQLLVLDSDALPEWWTVIPGTYRVLHGDPPPAPVPAQEVLVVRDEIGLAEAPGQADEMEREIVTVPDDRLWDYLKSKRGMIPSALHRVLSVSGRPAVEVWAMNRTRVLAELAAMAGVAPVHEAGIGYLDAALAAGGSPGDPAVSAAALRAGQRLLRAAGAWYAAIPGARRDRRTRGV